MKTEFNFVLDNKTKILISIPDLQLKFNYYYEPTEKLHKFDEAKVCFVSKQNEILLCQDILDHIIQTMHVRLKKASTNNLLLPERLKAGYVGAELNKMLNGISDLNLNPFWMWSALGEVQTLLYNYDNKIYLEIVPTFPDSFDDNSDKPLSELFKEFMKTYKPYFVTEIPIETAQQWLEQSEQIIQMINN